MSHNQLLPLAGWDAQPRVTCEPAVYVYIIFIHEKKKYFISPVDVIEMVGPYMPVNDIYECNRYL